MVHGHIEQDADTGTHIWKLGEDEVACATWGPGTLGGQVIQLFMRGSACTSGVLLGEASISTLVERSKA